MLHVAVWTNNVLTGNHMGCDAVQQSKKKNVTDDGDSKKGNY